MAAPRKPRRQIHPHLLAAFVHSPARTRDYAAFLGVQPYRLSRLMNKQQVRPTITTTLRLVLLAKLIGYSGSIWQDAA
jgi:hypothetical protein